MPSLYLTISWSCLRQNVQNEWSGSVGEVEFCLLWYSTIYIALVSGFKSQWSCLINLPLTIWLSALKQISTKNPWVDDNAEGTSIRKQKKIAILAIVLLFLSSWSAPSRGKKQWQSNQIWLKKTIQNVDLQPLSLMINLYQSVHHVLRN